MRRQFLEPLVDPQRNTLSCGPSGDVGGYDSGAGLVRLSDDPELSHWVTDESSDLRMETR